MEVYLGERVAIDHVTLLPCYEGVYQFGAGFGFPLRFNIESRDDPEFHEGKMEVRPSAKGYYTGLTVTVRAVSREQLDALYSELSAHPMVKIVM